MVSGTVTLKVMMSLLSSVVTVAGPIVTGSAAYSSTVVAGTVFVAVAGAVSVTSGYGAGGS